MVSGARVPVVLSRSLPAAPLPVLRSCRRFDVVVVVVVVVVATSNWSAVSSGSLSTSTLPRLCGAECSDFGRAEPSRDMRRGCPADRGFMYSWSSSGSMSSISTATT
jgi:hypothetical protein